VYYLKSIAKSTTIATPPWLLSRRVVDSDFIAQTRILLLLMIFSRTVFMNCVRVTRISIASTQMVLKLVTE